MSNKRIPAKLYQCSHGTCSYTARTEFRIVCHGWSCGFNPKVRKKNASERSELLGEELYPELDPLPPQLGGEGMRLEMDTNLFRSLNKYNLDQTELAAEAASNRDALSAVIQSVVHDECEDDDAEREIAVETVGVMMADIAELAGSKRVDNLISAILDEKFCLKRFKKCCQKARDCRDLTTHLFRKRISKDGFKEQKITMGDGQSYVIYSRNPVQVLQNQIKEARGIDLVTDPLPQDLRNGEPAFCHPMQTPATHRAYDAVRSAVQSSLRENVSWWSTKSGGGSVLDSFVGLGQLYSDKSATSLKAASFKFYPVHLTLLNFREGYKRSSIVQGKTLVAYLPTEIHQLIGDEEALKNSRPLQMKVLHDAMLKVFQPLIDRAETGFKCASKDGVIRLCHFALSSVCCDLSEAKDATSVNHGFTCHRCYVPAGEMNSTTLYPTRLLRDTLAVQEESKRCQTEMMTEWGTGDHFSRVRAAKLKARSAAVLREASVSVQTPFFKHFPFIYADESLEVYSGFLFEPMHNFQLGVSKLLKLCASERLSTTNCNTY